jgi:O-antigen/teichoic acid export membrane protein
VSKIRELLGDTVIYGLSTILGRLLNWLLLPLYIRTLSIEDNGYLTYQYGFIAIFQVLLTFGFETGFFRFAKNENFKQVFTSLLKFTIFSCSIFLLLVVFFNSKLESWLDIHDKGPVLIFMAAILFIDTISNLPFSLMRFNRESVKYSTYRFGQVLLTIVLNLLFLVFLPYINFSTESFFGFLGNEKYRLFNVFLANFLASFIVLILLSRYIFKNFRNSDVSIVQQVLWYSFPNILVGFFGMINLNIDRLMIPKLIRDDNVYEILGVYGANFKLGVLMAIFTQSFRLAFEPFFFKNQEEDNIPKPMQEL